jgi:hypothetical protein
MSIPGMVATVPLAEIAPVEKSQFSGSAHGSACPWSRLSGCWQKGLSQKPRERSRTADMMP